MLRFKLKLNKMTEFKLHNIETAPEDSKETLSSALKQNGFIPTFIVSWQNHQSY